MLSAFTTWLKWSSQFLCCTFPLLYPKRDGVGIKSLSERAGVLKYTTWNPSMRKTYKTFPQLISLCNNLFMQYGFICLFYSLGYNLILIYFCPLKALANWIMCFFDTLPLLFFCFLNISSHSGSANSLPLLQLIGIFKIAIVLFMLKNCSEP